MGLEEELVGMDEEALMSLLTPLPNDLPTGLPTSEQPPPGPPEAQHSTPWPIAETQLQDSGNDTLVEGRPWSPTSEEAGESPTPEQQTQRTSEALEAAAGGALSHLMLLSTAGASSSAAASGPSGITFPSPPRNDPGLGRTSVQDGVGASKYAIFDVDDGPIPWVGSRCRSRSPRLGQ